MESIRIDSHQHLWDLKRGDYDWLTPKLTPLYKNFLPTDLKPILDKASIDRTILVQAAPTVEETRYLLSLADENDFIVGVVGWVNLESENTRVILGELLEHPKFVGIRPMIQDIGDLDWILRSGLEKNISALIEYGLTFDALVQPKHLGNLLKFLERYPDLRVVIDHGAKPDIATDESENGLWFEQIKEIACSTQAYCKLSGFVTEAGDYPNIKNIQPYFEHIYSSFGASRIMWGSDWPIVNMKSDYQTWLEMSSDFLTSLNDIEKKQIFGETACQFYGIETEQQTLNRKTPIKVKSQFNMVHKDDNVLVCYRDVTAGDLVDIDGQRIILKQNIELGHKIARYPMQAGDKVIKSGAPIGSMTEPAMIGTHIHVHNMKSDYIQSHSRETINDDVDN